MTRQVFIALGLTAGLALAGSATNATTPELVTFYFPADPSYVVLSLDYDGGTVSYGGSYFSTAKEPDTQPYLQITGDAVLRIHDSHDDDQSDTYRIIEFGAIQEILQSAYRSGLLTSEYRDCKSASLSSAKSERDEAVFLPSSDLAPLRLSISAENVHGAPEINGPLRWSVKCDDSMARARYFADVRWLSALRALELRLLRLAKEPINPKN